MPASPRPKAGDEDLITLTWEDPPASRRGRSSVDWSKVVEPLRAQPKRWAKVRTFPGKTSAASSVKSFRKSVGPDFECVGRQLPEGGSAIFARFIGGAK